MKPRVYARDRLQAQAEGLHPWSMPSDVAALREDTFFALAFAMQPPLSAPPPRPVPVERSWAPDGRTRAPGAAKLALRHPSLDWALTEIEARRVPLSPRSTPRGFQHRVPTLKGCPRTMRCASKLEFEALLDCEFAPDVLRFIEQPFALRYPAGTRTRWHRPDVLLLTTTGLEAWEVKYEQQAEDDEERWEQIGPAFAELGVRFRVVTERHVSLSQRGDTVRALYRDRHSSKPSAEVLADVALRLADGRSASVAQIVGTWPELEPRHVHALVRRHFVNAVTLDVELDEAFEVRLGPGYATWGGPETRI